MPVSIAPCWTGSWPRRCSGRLAGAAGRSPSCSWRSVPPPPCGWMTGRSRSSRRGSTAGPACGWPRGRATATPTPTGWTARRSWRPPRPRPPPCARATSGEVVDLSALEGAGTNHVERPAGDVAAAQKVAWLRELDDTARAHSPEVVQVVGVYGDSLQRRLIATSDGRWIEEDRPRIRLVAQVVAKRGDNIQTGFHGPAACAGVEFLDAHGAERHRRGGRAARGDDARFHPRPGGRDDRGARAGDGWGPLPRGGRASARVRRGRQGGQHLPGPGRAAMRERADQRRGRRHGRQRVGVLRLRRRRNAEPAHGPVHRRGPAGVPLRPAARREGGRRLERERAARVLRPSAGPAHDQHLHPERQLVPGRGALLHARAASTSRRWAAAR